MYLQVTQFTSSDPTFLGIDSFAWRILIGNIFGLLIIAFVGVILWGVFKWAVRSCRKGWGNGAHIVTLLLLLAEVSS
jgi:hypothetical protein